MVRVLSRLIALILVVEMFLTGFALPVFAVEPGRVVRVGVYDNKPKIYRDQNGKISGLFADIVEFVAIQENWKVDYIYGSFAEGLERLKNGEIDLMVDTAYTEDRAKIYDFTNQTVLGSWGVIYVRKDADIDSFQDLDGKKIGILKSSVYLEGALGMKAYVNSFGISVSYVELPEYQEIFEQLVEKEFDAAVVSRIFGMSNERNYPELRATSIVFNPTELRFALHKGSPDNEYLIDRLDFWLKSLKEGYRDFYKDSLNKYGLLSASPQKEVIPKWVIYFGSILMGILLLSLIYNLALKIAREKVTKELKKKEMLLGNVVANTSIFLSATDSKGVITLFEGRGTGVQEFLPENVLGKPALGVFKDNLPVVQGLRKALAGEAVMVKAEIAKRVWKIQMTPLKDKGAVTAVVATAFDFTEEDRLAKEKTEFIYLASHHLRTPSNEIKWGLQLLAPKMEKCLSDKNQEIWRGVVIANDKIINLADTLSVCTWLDLYSFIPSPEQFDLEELMVEQFKPFDSIMKKKNLKIVKEEGGPLPIYMDKNKIRNILAAVIGNAAVYSPENGKITITTKQTGESLVISVADEGIGIPKNEQPMIFKRLYRASNAVKVYPNGVGLSLYMARMIAQNLGGKLSFESTENMGSTFYLELPLETFDRSNK